MAGLAAVHMRKLASGAAETTAGQCVTNSGGERRARLQQQEQQRRQLTSARNCPHGMRSHHTRPPGPVPRAAAAPSGMQSCAIMPRPVRVRAAWRLARRQLYLSRTPRCAYALLGEMQRIDIYFDAVQHGAAADGSGACAGLWPSRRHARALKVKRSRG